MSTTTSTKTSTRISWIAPVALAVILFSLVLIGSLAASKPVVESPSRIEENPVASAQIDVDDLTAAERTYLSQARTWGTTDLDTTRRTDGQLLAYGQATCTALEASGNPFEYRRTMSAAQAVNGGPMTSEDALMLENAAVNAWCFHSYQDFAEYTG